MLKRIVLILFLSAGIVFSQQNIFSPHDVFRTVSVDEAVISPDGNYAAFSVNKPRQFNGTPGSSYRELYLFAYSDNSVLPLLQGTVKVDDLGWTPDSKNVSFTAKLNDDKKSQVYTMPLDGSDTVRITDSKTTVINYQWHPSGNKMAFMAEEFVPEEDHKLLGFDQEVFEENIPGRFLYMLDLQTGTSSKLNNEGAVFDFKFSPDGNMIAAAIAPNNLVDDSYMFARLHTISLSTGEVTSLVENPGKLGNFSWNTNGTRLAFISGRDKNDAVDGSLFICDVPNNKAFPDLINYSKNFEGSVTDVHWLDNDNFIFVSEEGVYTTLRKQQVGGKDSELIINPGEAVFNSVSMSDGKLVFSGSTPEHPDELFTFNFNSGEVKRNTFHNKWLNNTKLARQVRIEYKASDGLMIEGLLFYPVNYREGEKYPMIIYIHGGPESTNSLDWNTAYNRWGQSAAGKDFFVFMPNYRAGSGRGYDFTMMGYGDAGGREFTDVLDGIDYLAEKGLIDKDRVGIGGGSYGGYFSAWAASRYSEHFAAAVSFVGIGNQLAKRNTTDIPWESYLVHWGKWVNDNPMEVYDRSPVRYAEKMNTPLLILHGDKDTRVHPSQSLEMYRAFKLKGNAPVRLVWYKGEGHGNSKNTNRLDYHLRTLNWFEYYLKGNNSKDGMPDNQLDYNLDEL